MRPVKPRLEHCPCCGYDHGSYFPRHCTDGPGKGCAWFRCKDCGAVTDRDGTWHIPDGPHHCGQTTSTDAEESA